MALPDYDEKTLLVEAARLSPSEAVAYFRAKGFKINWDWRETLGNANNQVFQIARATNLGVVQDIRSAMDAAISEGKTFKQFQALIEPRLALRGWTGKKFLPNPKTGIPELVELGTPRRLETIYRTNMQSAFNAGRWEDQVLNSVNRPYLKLIEILDGATRTTHRQMSGSIKPVNSSFWNVWYPPNGFNCRGRVQALTEAQAKKQGIGTQTDNLPDEGFSGNPGKAIFKPKKGDFDADLWTESKKMKPLPLGKIAKAPVNVVKKTAEFVAQDTIKAAEEWALKNNLADHVGYKGLDVKVANSVNQSVFEHLQKFPEARESLGFIGSSKVRRDVVMKLNFDAELERSRPFFQKYGFSEKKIIEQTKKSIRRQLGNTSKNTYAFASQSGRLKGLKGMVINDKWGDDFKKINDSMRKDTISGWHPKIESENLFKSLVDHEMGHILDFTYKLNELPEFRALYNPLTVNQIRNDLSRYAATNKWEFLAEAWTEYLNADNPREFAQAIGAIINKKGVKKP